ncbi:MAG TPA: cob(I)yrinic acid a,c-diamide adenosyltransferase [Armatimonadaceae bacterium]|nr:cob(I)yrinic acid a,c-diamide adenosyltransferase [Armatimonadaceae bacterium]
MKIYTRTGDTGDTGLYGGDRVRKDDVRVEAYGTVDEAGAALGVAATHLQDNELSAVVTRIQDELFVVGADLATPTGREERAGKSIVPRVSEAQAAALEVLIDRYEAELTPLRQFILPGGTPAAAHLHLARTVLRRAERRCVSLLDVRPDEANPYVVRYLNRAADLLFVLARVANRRAGVEDVPWTRPDSE